MQCKYYSPIALKARINKYHPIYFRILISVLPTEINFSSILYIYIAHVLSKFWIIQWVCISVFGIVNFIEFWIIFKTFLIIYFKIKTNKCCITNNCRCRGEMGWMYVCIMCLLNANVQDAAALERGCWVLLLSLLYLLFDIS